MPASPLITVKKLTKYYGRTVGVKEISFSIEPGEIFGFLGPNGAGKTTTIRVLLDLLRPTGGAVSIFGKAVSGNSLKIRRRCGYLPGDFSAYNHLSGDEFLHFAARMRNITPQRQGELLERFGLAEKELAQKIKHFSHGNLQKLGIIQAFFHWPELLILDEPTLGLDPLMQEAFYALLKDYRQSGGTVFFSSHNLPEVEKVCHRVAIIRRGELVALETLENLKRKRFRKLKLTLKTPLENLELPGAQLISRSGAEYVFLVKSDLEMLLRRLAELPVSDLIFPEPELEEVFLAYYRKQNHE
jgi:ABC-2 type transport system ATP-binding protein